MSPNVTTVLAVVQSLTPAERQELIDHLLDDESESEVPTLSEAWKEEIARRSAEYDAGLAETVTWEEIKARWEARRTTGG